MLWVLWQNWWRVESNLCLTCVSRLSPSLLQKSASSSVVFVSSTLVLYRHGVLLWPAGQMARKIGFSSSSLSSRQTSVAPFLAIFLPLFNPYPLLNRNIPSSVPPKPPARRTSSWPYSRPHTIEWQNEGSCCLSLLSSIILHVALIFPFWIDTSVRNQLSRPLIESKTISFPLYWKSSTRRGPLQRVQRSR